MAPPTARGSSAAGVLVDEPPMPRRVRRPLDAVRLVLSLLALALVVALAAATSRTTGGLDQDLSTVGQGLPDALVGIVAVASALVGLVYVPVLTILRLLRRRYWNAGLVVAATVLGLVTTAAASALLRRFAPAGISGDFVPALTAATPSLSGFVAALVAAGAAAGVSRRSRTVLVLTVSAALATALISGTTTVLSAAASLAIGRAAGLAVRLIAGWASVRPDGYAVAAALAAAGQPVASLSAVGVSDGARHYVAGTAGTRELDIDVLDRDRVTAGLLSVAWRAIRTREEVLPREELSLERAVERRSVLVLAATAAGVRTPPLVAAVAVEPDAALLAYERRTTTPFAELGADDVGEDAVADTWQQVGLLSRAGIAHRSLSPAALHLDADGRVWVYDANRGEVAASAFARLLDRAHVLVALAMTVGVPRAVASTRKMLSTQDLADVVPLLQPIALPGATRGLLGEHPGLLSSLRDEVGGAVEVEPAAPVPLERFRPRVLLTVVGLGVALYLIGTELAGVDFAGVIRQSDWRWVVVGLVAVALTYIGTAAALLGFVKQRVPYFRTIGAQLALSFVKLVAPSAVSNAAVNIRLLTKAGVPASAAAASIAAGQLAAFIVTVPLLLVLSVLTGQAVASGFAPSPTALGVVGFLVLVVALLLLVRPVRERLRKLWQSFVEQGLPQLLDAVQTPHKLLQGVGGNLLLTIGYSLALYACVRAVGAEIGIAAVAIVFLTGNTVGSAVPTPGGLGAVEAALVAGLGAAGVTGSLSVPAVLLFRLLSFWLPLLPGYIAWNRMQAKGYL